MFTEAKEYSGYLKGARGTVDITDRLLPNPQSLVSEATRTVSDIENFKLKFPGEYAPDPLF